MNPSPDFIKYLTGEHARSYHEAMGKRDLLNFQLDEIPRIMDAITDAREAAAVLMAMTTLLERSVAKL